MREQLGRLAELSAQTNVTLQVLPNAVGAHIAMLGAFVLLSFPEATDPDVVYLDTDTSSFYLEKPEEIARYTLVFDHLRATASPVQESVTLINSLARDQ